MKTDEIEIKPPFKVVPIEGNPGNAWVMTEDGSFTVCHAEMQYAVLFASAPDVLKALKYCFDRIPMMMEDECKIRAVIAKAEGK